VVDQEGIISYLSANMVEQALMQGAWSGGFAKVIRVVDIHTTKYDKVVGPMKQGYSWGTNTASVLLHAFSKRTHFFQ
jgi:hypothetical protein